MKALPLFFLIFFLTAVTACSEDSEPLDIAAVGGTTITAEVDVADFLLSEADFSNDTLFLRALDESRKGNVGGKDRIAAFVNSFNELSPDQPAGAFFNGQQPRFYPQSLSADQLIKRLCERYDSATKASELIIGKRLASFGTEQSQWKVSTDGKGHVIVDLAKEVDAQRIRNLLVMSARFGFYETMDVLEAYQSLEALEHNCLRFMETTEMHPILSRIQIGNQGGSGLIGYVEIRDTAAINEFLKIGRTPGLIRSDQHFVWGFAPEQPGGRPIMALYGIEADNLMVPVIDGKAITHAAASKDPVSGQNTVDLKMTPEGANRWADMTENNINRAIAIVFEGKVLSCPNVVNAITDGNTQISGNFTQAQHKELAAFLSSSPLPARMTILDMKTVSGK